MTVSATQYNGSSDFVHLHNHTVYSTLDGISTPEQYAEQCYNRGYPAMSATEHGHMASVPDMYLAFRQHKLKFIAGCEIYYNDYEKTRQDMVERGQKLGPLKLGTPEEQVQYYRIVRNRHLTILAKNQVGYHNLIKLTTQAFDTGLFGTGRTKYPRIWFDKLCEFKEGLIILSGCLNGPIAHELRLRQLDYKKDIGTHKAGEIFFQRDWRECVRDARKLLLKFKEAFGDDYYMEFQMPRIPMDDEVFRLQLELADKYKIKKALCNDCHYLRREDFELQKIMMAIGQNTTVNDPELFHVNSDEQFMKSRADLWATFRNGTYSHGVDDRVFHEMCDTTLLIADKCKPLKIDTEPKYPEIQDSDSELYGKVMTRLRHLGLDKISTKFLIDGNEVTYTEQAELELDRMISKGFSSYFLITEELLRYGKEKGWPFSPRGSAGGSLVCYLLGITSINPLLWGLSFDRFLSPSRGGYMLDVRME